MPELIMKAQNPSTQATREDLTSTIDEVRAEIRVGFDELRRQALALHEDLKSDLRLLAEQLVAIKQRLDVLTKRVETLAHRP